MPNKTTKHKGNYIFRASFTDKNGVTHYAKDYGKKAFRIPLSANTTSK